MSIMRSIYFPWLGGSRNHPPTTKRTSEHPSHVRSHDGRKYRMLNTIGEFTWECSASRVNRDLTPRVSSMSCQTCILCEAFLDMFFHCCSSPRKRTWAYQHDECPFMTSRHPCSRNCRRTASAARANVPSVATATPAGRVTEEMRSSSPSKPPFSDEHVRAPLLFEGQFVFDRLIELRGGVAPDGP
jgi:hypothetical protein